MDLTVLAEDFWGDLSITLFPDKNEWKKISSFRVPERRKELSSKEALASPMKLSSLYSFPAFEEKKHNDISV